MDQLVAVLGKQVIMPLAPQTALQACRCRPTTTFMQASTVLLRLVTSQGNAVMIDCRSLEGMSVPAGNSQVKFLLTDSQVKHALVSAAQATLFQFAHENWSQQ